MSGSSTWPRGSPEDIFNSIRNEKVKNALKQAGRKAADDLMANPELRQALLSVIAKAQPASEALLKNKAVRAAANQIIPNLTDEHFAIGCVVLGGLLGQMKPRKK